MDTVIDTRLIELPSASGAVYVVKDGAFIPTNYIDGANISHETWTMTLEDHSIITKDVATWTS